MGPQGDLSLGLSFCKQDTGDEQTTANCCHKFWSLTASLKHAVRICDLLSVMSCSCPCTRALPGGMRHALLFCQPAADQSMNALRADIPPSQDPAPCGMSACTREQAPRGDAAPSSNGIGKECAPLHTPVAEPNAARPPLPPASGTAPAATAVAAPAAPPLTALTTAHAAKRGAAPPKGIAPVEQPSHGPAAAQSTPGASQVCPPHK